MFGDAPLRTLGGGTGSGVFEGTPLTSVDFAGSRVESVYLYAFRNCRSLKRVSFASSGVQTVSSGAFFGCRALENVDFTNTSLTSVDDRAFDRTPCDATLQAAAQAAVGSGRCVFHAPCTNAALQVCPRHPLTARLPRPVVV